MTTRRGPRREPIDWQAVHRRLARSQAAFEEALAPSPERARAVLDERARALARATAAAPTPEQILEVLVFSLGRERYAIESRHVREVMRTGELTPVPGTPSFVVGITNLRGEILLVVDLRKVFHVSATGLSDLARVIVLGDVRPELGVLADETHEIQAMARSDLHEPPESIAGIARDHLLGVTASAVVVLNGASLLADERMYVRSTIPDPHPSHAAT